MAMNRGERRRRPEVHVAELLRRSNEDDNRWSSSPASATAQYRSANRVVPDILSRKRQATAMQHGMLVPRGTATGLCLAMLAADTRKGWALDSYGNYSQFRYSEAMNVIGFVYSVLQFAALIGLMRKNKHLEYHPKRDLFDFTMIRIIFYDDLRCCSQNWLSEKIGNDFLAMDYHDPMEFEAIAVPGRIWGNLFHLSDYGYPPT